MVIVYRGPAALATLLEPMAKDTYSAITMRRTSQMCFLFSF